VKGTRESATVQNWSTAIKVGALLLMSVLLIAGGDGYVGAGDRLFPERLTLPLLSGIGLAVIAVLWAYEGWQHVTYSVGEAIDPQRDFPRAIVAGTLTLIAVYMLANVAYIAALGPEAAAASDRVAADAVGALLGPLGGKLIAAAIIISMFSAANGITLTAPRVFYAMAADGLFFRKLAEVHPRFGTPVFAVLAASAWAAILALTGTFEQLLTYVIFVGWLFYALGAASIFVFRRRRPDAPRPFRVPGYPWTPAIFVLTAAVIVVNTVFAQTGLALIGLGIVALGMPAYFLWSRRGGGPQ
jgi:APA family basic amino acid/polyamine antiporter